VGIILQIVSMIVQRSVDQLAMSWSITEPIYSIAPCCKLRVFSHGQN